MKYNDLQSKILTEFTGILFMGLKASYKPAADHLDKLYFANDTHELLVNGTSYSGGVSAVSIEGTTLKITMVDGSSKTVNLAEILKYKSALADDIATVNALGGIPAGTTVAQLKNKTFSQLFDELIFPTVNPTFENPIASLSLKSTSTIPIIQEVGTTGASVPVAASFIMGYNPGAIKIAGVKKQNRGGGLRQDESFIYINNTPTNKKFPTEIPEGIITYKYRAAYAQGPQPLDSKGNNYQTPLSAGTVDSPAVTITGVYPYFTNKDNNAAFAKLPLTIFSNISVVKFKAEGPNKHTFKIPAKYTLTKVELLNTLSGKYENYGIDKFTKTTENIEVQGKQVSYAVYTRNDAGFNGESTFNITFSK
jgi:hypothetical protein